MSIDARITAVTVIAPNHCATCNGTRKDPESPSESCPSCHGATKDNPVVRLKLEPREPSGHIGQSVLTIANPPTTDPKALSSLIGTEIWGDCDSIMIGDKRWAKRLGYTRIELVT